MEHWHAILTKPHKEARVAETLAGRGVEVFAPMLRFEGKRGQPLEKPFFPRYILARFDWCGAGFGHVQWTPGLASVVMFDRQPAWLRDAEVAYLQARLAGLDGDAFMRLKPGQAVRVTKGPFRDFEAMFAGYLNGEARVAILLDILGRQTRVCVGADAVERTA